MTADSETLRRAAALMREQHGPKHERHAMWGAMADLLDATAFEHESDSGNPTVDNFFCAFDTAPDVATIAVARIYLGEQP